MRFVCYIIEWVTSLAPSTTCRIVLFNDEKRARWIDSRLPIAMAQPWHIIALFLFNKLHLGSVFVLSASSHRVLCLVNCFLERPVRFSYYTFSCSFIDYSELNLRVFACASVWTCWCRANDEQPMEYEMLLLYIDNDFSVKCVFTIARLVILFCRNNGPLVRSLKTNRVTFFLWLKWASFTWIDHALVLCGLFLSVSGGFQTKFYTWYSFLLTWYLITNEKITSDWSSERRLNGIKEEEYIYIYKKAKWNELWCFDWFEYFDRSEDIDVDSHWWWHRDGKISHNNIGVRRWSP